MSTVTVVVGGQYGSEGKGKVAQFLAKEQRAEAVVRIGGSNSGHTGFSDGERHVLRQLPTAALLPDVLCVLGPGSYIDVRILVSELERLELDPQRLVIDSRAFVITDEDRASEARTGQIARIGSTGSGTGAAVQRRIARVHGTRTVADELELLPFVADSSIVLRSLVERGARVIVEGTQGFGLSLLHSRHHPYVTSRDTSAAGAVAEAGLSPLDVDQVVLVIRTHPIRVAGESGPLPNEIDWETVRRESGAQHPLDEVTSVTKKIRRVARFDPGVVREAIAVNRPTVIVMNHIDHVDARCAELETLTDRALSFISETSSQIGSPIDLVGLGPTAVVPLAPRLARVAS